MTKDNHDESTLVTK